MPVTRSIAIDVFFETGMAWSHVGALRLMVSRKVYRSVEPDQDLRWPRAAGNQLNRLISRTTQNTQAGSPPVMPGLDSVWAGHCDPGYKRTRQVRRQPRSPGMWSNAVGLPGVLGYGYDSESSDSDFVQNQTSRNWCDRTAVNSSQTIRKTVQKTMSIQSSYWRAQCHAPYRDGRGSPEPSDPSPASCTPKLSRL